MSHPERLGASGGAKANAIAEPPSLNGSVSLAEFAIAHGLKQSAARPPMSLYIRQLWQRRNFIWTFASAKSMAMYTGSRLGQLWQVLTPLLNAAVFYLIFGILLGRKGDVTNYIPFLVIGVFFFHFIQRSIQQGSKSVQSNMSLIRALHFPRATLPFSYTIVELQQLFAAVAVLIVILLGFGEYPAWSWLLLIPALLLELTFNIGASLVVARIGAFVPDLSQLLPFILRTWLYFSGIMFSVYTLAGKLPFWAIHLMGLNPASDYIEVTRRALMPSYSKDLAHTKAVNAAACARPLSPYASAAAEKAQTKACRIHAAIVNMDQTVWYYATGWAVVALVVGFWYFYRADERYGRG
jgi:teichoic acid transport system permease protein